MRIQRLAAGLALVLALAGAAAANQHTDKPKSLYERIGGYDALTAVVDDFVGRLATDPTQSRFFVGHSDDSKKRIRQHIIEFLCQAFGGPCAYTGRSMKVAHAGLPITEADWDTSVKLLVATLDKFKVPEKEKGEILAAASSLKPDIVAAPAVTTKK